MSGYIKINNINASEIDVYARLTGAQLRTLIDKERGIFIAESPNVIATALDAGMKPISLLTDEKLLRGEVADIISRIDKMSTPEEPVPIYVGKSDTLRSITGFELTRGALSAMYRPTPKTVSEVLKGARTVAVLENIADAANVGAIFRSAAALGIDAVLVTPSACDPLSRRAIRVSMGAVFQIPWARIGSKPADWPKMGITELHEYGFKCVSMALRRDTVSIDDNTLAGEERLALILGTEGTGLLSETIDLSDYTVKIPMYHGVDSLNVGAAAAVAFWQLSRRGNN